MSTETLVEKVQSVVLERLVGISRRTTCLCKFRNSRPAKFPTNSSLSQLPAFKPKYPDNKVPYTSGKWLSLALMEEVHTEFLEENDFEY